jgi:hypothetical protein
MLHSFGQNDLGRHRPARGLLTLAMTLTILAGAATSVTQAADTGSDRPAPRTVADLYPITLAAPAQGVVLGQAYDMAAQRWLPSVCVEGAAQPLGAGELVAQYNDLQDMQQLFDSMKVSASGSAHFGLGGGDVSLDYARSVTIQRERRNILATISSSRGGTQLVPAQGTLGVALTDQALRPLHAGAFGKADPATFSATCGHGYAAAIRRGARLALAFSWLMNKDDVQETFKGNASGNYGPFSMKAALERIHKDTSETLQTTVSVLQNGGDRNQLPITAVEALDRIKGFGKYDEADAVPLEVVVIPYKVLANAPAVLRQTPLPDTGVRDLTTHYWRLAELSNLYARAALTPDTFYHPWTAPEREPGVARALQLAATCTAAMIDACEAGGTCSMQALAQTVWNTPACPGNTALTGVNPDEILQASRAIGGNRFAVEQLKGHPSFRTGEAAQKIGALAARISTPPASTGTAGAGSTPARSDAWTESPWGLWLHYLARAPWPRTIDEKTQASSLPPTDLMALLDAFCSSAHGAGACASTKPEALADPKSVPDASGQIPAAQTLSELTVRMRLGPLAAQFCQRDISSPLCQLPDVLAGYLKPDLDDEPAATFGPARGFTRLASPPPPPPKVEPREPRLPGQCNFFKPPRRGDSNCF